MVIPKPLGAMVGSAEKEAVESLNANKEAPPCESVQERVKSPVVFTREMTLPWRVIV